MGYSTVSIYYHHIIIQYFQTLTILLKLALSVALLFVFKINNKYKQQGRR